MIGYTNDMGDKEVAELGDWADYHVKNTPNPEWKRAYALIREGTDLLLRRRAMTRDNPEQEPGTIKTRTRHWPGSYTPTYNMTADKLRPHTHTVLLGSNDAPMCYVCHPELKMVEQNPEQEPSTDKKVCTRAHVVEDDGDRKRREDSVREALTTFNDRVD